MTPGDPVPAPGFDGYFVTDAGRVFSERRGARVELRQPLSNGYPCVGLRRDGRTIVVTVHVLVLSAFVGPRPDPSHHGRHLDGNPRNNKLSNLAWGTPSENVGDMLRHGRHGAWTKPERYRRGSAHPRAKLTEEQVNEIRAAISSGASTLRGMARKFGVTAITVRRAVDGTSWAHQPNGTPVDVRRLRHNSGSRRLSEEQALQILKMRAGGVGAQELSRRFGVSVFTIHDLCAGRTWSHLGRKERAA